MKYLTGERLYEIYEQANGSQSIGVDPWESLCSEDKAIWRNMASRIEAELRQE